MKSIQAFTQALLVTGCLSNPPIEQREVILRYGETAVSAEIQGDGTFETSKDTEHETVAFSGTVSEQDEMYRIDLAFSRQIKSSESRSELDTTVVLMANESVTVGGVNNDVYRVALE